MAAGINQNPPCVLHDGTIHLTAEGAWRDIGRVPFLALTTIAILRDLVRAQTKGTTNHVGITQATVDFLHHDKVKRVRFQESGCSFDIAFVLNRDNTPFAAYLRPVAPHDE